MLAVAAVLALGAAVWLDSSTQRSAADSAADLQRSARNMLVGMLDQETGFRGLLLTHREEFLEPYVRGRAEYDQSLAAARGSVTQDARGRGLLSRSAVAAARWQRLAAGEIVTTRSLPNVGFDVQRAVQRKAVMDSFRVQNAAFARYAEARGSSQQVRAARFAVGSVLVLVAVFGVAAWFLIVPGVRRRRAQRHDENAYQHDQHEFSESVQATDSEDEAHSLLKRHLELSIPESQVTILRRNHSDDRLEPATVVAPDSQFSRSLESAAPRSCLAVRLGHVHDENPDRPQLMTCELCGATGRQVTCSPLLVAGQVIGSVLVERDDLLDQATRRRVADSVDRAAPVTANLRNLALAEARASTDALTGLANRRSADDTLKRMVAHARRAGLPLVAVMFDLDHFKDINDRFGHEQGDNVLAAASEAARHTLRASDFVGRTGGEEFIVLLPDTDLSGGVVAAEKLREAIGAIDVVGVERGTTASFGVAAFPEHAREPETLLRQADRALYLAKQHGRNRVEAATQAGVAPDAAPPVSADPAVNGR